MARRENTSFNPFEGMDDIMGQYMAESNAMSGIEFDYSDITEALEDAGDALEESAKNAATDISKSAKELKEAAKAAEDAAKRAHQLEMEKVKAQNKLDMQRQKDEAAMAREQYKEANRQARQRQKDEDKAIMDLINRQVKADKEEDKRKDKIAKDRKKKLDKQNKAQADKKKREAEGLKKTLGLSGLGQLGAIYGAYKAITGLSKSLIDLTRASAAYSATLNKTYSAFGGIAGTNNLQTGFDNLTTAWNEFKANLFNGDFERGLESIINTVTSFLNYVNNYDLKARALGYDSIKDFGKDKALTNTERTKDMRSDQLFEYVSDILSDVSKMEEEEARVVLENMMGKKFSDRIFELLPQYIENLGSRALEIEEEALEKGWNKDSFRSGTTAMESMLWTKGMGSRYSKDLTDSIIDSLTPIKDQLQWDAKTQLQALNEITSLLESGSGTSQLTGVTVNEQMLRALLPQWSEGKYAATQYGMLGQQDMQDLIAYAINSQLPFIEKGMTDELHDWQAQTMKNGQYLEQIKDAVYSFDEVINTRERKTVGVTVPNAVGGTGRNVWGDINMDRASSISNFVTGWAGAGSSQEKVNLLVKAGYTDKDAATMVKLIEESGLNGEAQANLAWKVYAEGLNGTKLSIDDLKKDIDEIKKSGNPEIIFKTSNVDSLKEAMGYLESIGVASKGDYTIIFGEDHKDVDSALQQIKDNIKQMNDDDLLHLLMSAGYSESDAGKLLQWIKEVADGDKDLESELVFDFYAEGVTGNKISLKNAKEKLDKIKAGAKPEYVFNLKKYSELTNADKIVSHFEKTTGLNIDFGLSASAQNAINKINTAYNQLKELTGYKEKTQENNDTSSDTKPKFKDTEDAKSKTSKLISDYQGIAKTGRLPSQSEIDSTTKALYDFLDYMGVSEDEYKSLGIGDLIRFVNAVISGDTSEISTSSLLKNLFEKHGFGVVDNRTSNEIPTFGSKKYFPKASGGIVTGPTKTLMGEGGRAEAVIPLETQGGIEYLSNALKMAGLGGGSGQTTVNVNLRGEILDMNDYNTRRLGERLAAIIDNEHNRRGGLNYNG